MWQHYFSAALRRCVVDLYLRGGDPQSLEAVIIDTVFLQRFRDCALVGELGLKLLAVLDTHCHADHVTGAWLMQQATSCRIGISKRYGDAVDLATVILRDADFPWVVKLHGGMLLWQQMELPVVRRTSHLSK